MKLVLKILALPVLFVVKVICVLGNLLTNVVSYVIGILLLVIGGSAIYCIVTFERLAIDISSLKSSTRWTLEKAVRTRFRKASSSILLICSDIKQCLAPM